MIDRTVPALLLLALLGCVPAEEPAAKSFQKLAESQAALNERLAKREAPKVEVRAPDLSPLIEEIRRLRQASERRPYTGAVVHVDAQDDRCLPCRLLKRDLETLARESAWTFGFDDRAHWKLVPHERPDFAVPRIEFIVDGRVVDSVNGYPNQPSRPGYYGPIDDLVRRHPRVSKR